MEKVLLKLARQLNAFDEASLMSLWDKYAAQVQSFEPTRRWEEAALVFGFIQTLRMKNQLFNHHWAESARPKGARLTLDPSDPLFRGLEALGRPETDSGEGPAGGHNAKQRAKVLRFRPPEGDDTV
ncbi:MAG: hypothetical protein H0S85_16645 [Desulfovibrionaceae bacterium]|jgi:hypothetical protein|nr:hypothetical protein [Desulfovibrionaceae bacterium]